jgi:hypothetical protein
MKRGCSEWIRVPLGMSAVAMRPLPLSRMESIEKRGVVIVLIDAVWQEREA